VTHTNELPRESNLLGALSLAVTERIGEAVEVASAQGSSAPAALAALETFLEGESIDALRRVLGLTHSGAVRLVDRLQSAALIERRRAADGRAVALALTPAGREAARRVLAEREGALRSLLAPLTADERSELARLHGKLLAGMATDRESARHLCRLCDPVACGHWDGRCPVTEGRRSRDRSQAPVGTSGPCASLAAD
jgi:MarR family transcriptional repressor of emrRAB